jgi:hypothetical protein
VDLPEKLVGKNPEHLFLSKAPVPEVPGTIGQEIDQKLFRIKPRPVDPIQGSWTIKVLVLKEFEKEIVIRKDANIFEILALAFEGMDIPIWGKMKIATKLSLLTNGAIYRVEEVSGKVRMALSIPFWDGRIRRCGIIIAPNATINEIVKEAEKEVEEPLEDEKCHEIKFGGHQAFRPWEESIAN